MKDFLLFRKMISPWLIQILFWLSVLIFICIAIIDIAHEVNYLLVFEVLILGPIISRVICEILILFFRVNENLIHIKRALAKNNPEDLV